MILARKETQPRVDALRGFFECSGCLLLLLAKGLDLHGMGGDLQTDLALCIARKGKRIELSPDARCQVLSKLKQAGDAELARWGLGLRVGSRKGVKVDLFEGLVGLARRGRKIVRCHPMRRADIFDFVEELLDFLAKVCLRSNRDAMLELGSE